MMQPQFDNSYALLPERFYARVDPTPVARPRLIKLNVGLARDLGLDTDWLASEEGIAMLAGNRMPPAATPIAQAYAGHQFGGFSPQLGDGRAILLGEVIGRDGQRRDLQLKGSGPTPFSRRGDGRAALGPVLREYIVAEAMYALGVPTTRALAAITTGEHVLRERPLPGGVLTRVAASHIRVGTFQFFAARGDTEAVRALADYVIDHHYADARGDGNPVRALLAAVATRQAKLIAQWLCLGFVHGVMNTDNMAVSGETIDYGPCAFMDAFSPAQVYSSIDTQGRYAYGKQPDMGLWNLTRFAETLLPLLHEQEEAVQIAEEALDAFSKAFTAAHTAGLLRKAGLPWRGSPVEADIALVRDLLKLMAEQRADFTLTFRQLADWALDGPGEGEGKFVSADALAPWLARWQARLAELGGNRAQRRADMRGVNPAYIPRNHRVEEVIAAAVIDGDMRPFELLVEVLAKPYDDQPEYSVYQRPPLPHEIVQATFCGT
jgi:serine/tyrosine/threonine adenylyltransferase